MEYTKEQQSANRKLWVAALRSGKYMQGIGVLRYSNDFCCLGVACDVLNIPFRIDNGYYVYGNLDDENYDVSRSTLPKCVMDILGITSTGQFKNEDQVECSLTQLNDTLKMSFEQIADLIEKYENDLVEFAAKY